MPLYQLCVEIEYLYNCQIWNKTNQNNINLSHKVKGEIILLFSFGFIWIDTSIFAVDYKGIITIGLVCCSKTRGCCIFRSDRISSLYIVSNVSVCYQFVKSKLKYLNTWVLEYLNTWILQYLNTWILEYLNTWILEYLNTWLLDYLNTWILLYFAIFMSDIVFFWNFC